MTQTLLLGKFQPFKKDHVALVRRLLSENKKIVIGCRDLKASKDTPYTYKDIKKRVRKSFTTNELKLIKVISLPDCDDVVIHRS